MNQFAINKFGKYGNVDVTATSNTIETSHRKTFSLSEHFFAESDSVNNSYQWKSMLWGA